MKYKEEMQTVHHVTIFAQEMGSDRKTGPNNDKSLCEQKEISIFRVWRVTMHQLRIINSRQNWVVLHRVLTT